MEAPVIPIRRRSALSAECDYSRAFYLDPPSHDFLVWLVIAELMRRHHKAPGPLRVKFGLFRDQLGVLDFGPLNPWKIGPDGTIEAYPCGVSKAYSDQMLEHVLRPAIEMMGAVEEPALHAPFPRGLIQHHADYDYHIGQLVDAAREGVEVPKFTPPQWAFEEVDEALRGVRPIVITLRETECQRERNSRLADWLRFASEIEDEFSVVFVRDTAKAYHPLPLKPEMSRDDYVWPTWPRASKNAYVRAALYQRALVNMMVGTGPCGWCQFSDAPYLLFKQLVPELPLWDHGQAFGWKEQAHLDVGEQYPWANPRQRLTWRDDTVENLRDEFTRFMESA